MRQPALIVTLGLLASTVAAQSPVLDIARIRPGVDSMSLVIVRQGEETPAGMLWDSIAILHGPSGQTLRRTYRTDTPLFGSFVEVVVSVLPSLRPVSLRSSSALGSDSLEVWRDSLSGWHTDQQGRRSPLRRRLALEAIAGRSFDLVIRAHDWESGKGLSVLAYLPGRDTVVTLTAHLAESADTVTTRNGRRVSCWRIDGDYGGSPMTFWLDRRSRAIVKQTIALGPGVTMVALR